MLAEIFNARKIVVPVVLLGLLAAIGIAVADWNNSYLSPLFNNMIRFDHFAISFAVIIVVTIVLWILANIEYLTTETNLTDYLSLVLFGAVGAVLLISFQNLAMFFIGLEILSIPMYILSGSKKHDLASNESAFKYFLMGAFATGIVLFGVAMLYGASGTFDVIEMGEKIAQLTSGSSKVLASAGLLFLMIGMAFKVSAVPFHFWTPDVYQGAPTPVTAFMGTVVKSAAFAAFFRLFAFCFYGLSGNWTNVLWAITAVTILLPNITALYQTNVKRMLAYSSIAHAGYMLLSILSMNIQSGASVVYYAAAYSIASIAAFTTLYIVSEKKQLFTYDAFNGLSKSNPALALSLSIALLSLAGIPPAAGFFAKYFIFSTAINSGFTGIVIIAVLGSLVSLYYYLKLIIAMYFKEKNGEAPEISLTQNIVLIITSILILVLGLYPDILLKWLL